MTRAWILPMLFVLAALLSAFLGARVPELAPDLPEVDREAQRRSAVDGRPVVFWRPGCAYCMRLRVRLGRGSRQVYWVDIWRDPAGAAAVRAADERQ